LRQFEIARFCARRFRSASQKRVRKKACQITSRGERLMF
jgi:hypothetical protein